MTKTKEIGPRPGKEGEEGKPKPQANYLLGKDGGVYLLSPSSPETPNCFGVLERVLGGQTQKNVTSPNR